jgi:hypothetical protein
MEVIVDGRRHRPIPELLGPWLEAYARARGRSVEWVAPDTLAVHGPLHGRRVALDLGEEAGPLQPVATQTALVLERLDAAALITGGDGAPLAERQNRLQEFAPDVLICLRLSRFTSSVVRGLRAQPLGRFRRSDMNLAKVLLERLAARTGLPSRGVPLWAWSEPALAPLAGVADSAAVVVECGCPANREDAESISNGWFAMRCAAGLGEGLLRFAGLTAEQAAAYRLAAPQKPGVRSTLLPDLEPASSRPAGRRLTVQRPELMEQTAEGEWVSPRARVMLERHLPDAEE